MCDLNAYTYFFNPSGVMSNIQEKITAMGKPIISRTIMNVTVQSGKPNLGNIISPASMIIKAVAAYMAITLMTLRRFNSSQNRKSLLDLSGIGIGVMSLAN